MRAALHILAVCGLLGLGLATGCGRSPTPEASQPASAAKAATAAQTAKAAKAAPTTKTPSQAASASAPAQAKPARPTPPPSAQRRKRRPTIIGGCDERCETPQLAANTFFDALQRPEPAATVRQLIDWSLLELDGDKRGDRWSDMWADRRQHPKRAAEISAWLDGWLATLRLAKQADLLRSRASGVQIKPLAGRTDVVEMRWRHPPLPKAGGEPEWRILWTRRGYEWLISRIDQAPSRRPLGTPPEGTSTRGHL